MPVHQQTDNRVKPSAKLLNTLASVKFAVTVVVLIAVACVLGTLLPQGTDVAKYVARNPDAAGRMELFGTLGLTHVFYSAWFIALLCTLAATVATCSTRRFATVLRTVGFARRRAFGSMLTHISILLILAGGVIRGAWGEKGHLEFREGQTRAEFTVEKGRKSLPFALQLADFQIETYGDAEKHQGGQNADQLLVEWPEKNLRTQLAVQVGVEQRWEAFRIKVLRYVPDFVVDMSTRKITSRSDRPNNPAILVAVAGPAYQNHRWVFAKFPDFGAHDPDGQGTTKIPLRLIYRSNGARPRQAVSGPIKSFKSTIHVVEDGQVVVTRVVEVNRPFRHKGYTFYQSGYNPRDHDWTSFQVVKDPGVPVVYAGFSLMILGLFVVFYLNPWIEQKKVSTGPRAQVPEREASRSSPTPTSGHSATQAFTHAGT